MEVGVGLKGKNKQKKSRKIKVADEGGLVSDAATLRTLERDEGHCLGISVGPLDEIIDNADEDEDEDNQNDDAEDEEDEDNDSGGVFL